MPSVILQPADLNHFTATIHNPVALDRMTSHLSSDETQELLTLYPSRLIPTWGVTPGANGANANKWLELRPGDVVLFLRKGQFWEHVYFVDNVRETSIPMAEVSKVIPYGTDVVRGFTVLDKIKSANVIRLLEKEGLIERVKLPVRFLQRFSGYSREEIHDIFAPETPFTPQAGTWGLQGIVEIPERPGDFAFFVTLGQIQGEHRFEEGVTEDGILTWQSQPRQRLGDDQIKRLIGHNEDRNTIYLFLRTNRNRDYTYMGNLKYLSHDPSRENPVYFEWQILDWEIPERKLQSIDLHLLAPYEITQPDKPVDTLFVVQPPFARTAAVEEISGVRRFRGRKSPDYAERDAKNRGLGRKGEELVLEYERKNLTEGGRPELAEKIRHISVLEGDGAGYDISSFRLDGQRKYIEVKTTEGDAATDLFISANELEFSRVHANEYCLYRVFEYDVSRNSGKMFVHSGPLEPRYTLEATQFRAKLS